VFRHFLRRAAGVLFALLVVSVLIFVLLDCTPGDAAETLVGDSASTEHLESLRHEMGLDLPVPVRYLNYIKNLILHGSLGQSMISRREVMTLIGERLPGTLLLALTAAGLALLVGLVVGVTAAMRSSGLLDVVLMGLASIGMGMPSFWSALLLLMFFSLKLQWLPVVGAGTPKHLILPAVTLALPTATVVARLVRASVLEQLGASYVRTAHAKGLPVRGVLWRHVLRNGLIPVVNLLGLYLGHLVGGAFVVETIFGWPGLGRLTVQAIFDRDMPVVMGAALTIAVIYLLINLVVDVLHEWLDPRVAQQVV
jgi:ABC-type dipeptide/oligopeptide/nickel transport system permease component